MKRIVVSQPMFFPWSGLFDQIRLADVFVHYDDVALPQGRSFMSRVQLKTPAGVEWLTAPIVRGMQMIQDVRLDNTQRWRAKHLNTLRHNYAGASFANDMIGLVEDIYAADHAHLADINIAAIERIAHHLGLTPQFIRSSACGTHSSSSEKLVEIVSKLGGDVYITGHGARNYLDHELFEKSGIAVEYMSYALKPYRQLHGVFTPYVSILDALANLGRDAAGILASRTIPWRDFLNG